MTPVTVREPAHIRITRHPVMTGFSVTVLTPAAAEACTVHAGNPCPETECNTCQEATDSCFDTAGTLCTDDGNVCTDDTCDGAGACAHPNNTAPCDDGFFCNGTDTCSGGACTVNAGNPCPGDGV